MPKMPSEKKIEDMGYELLFERKKIETYIEEANLGQETDRYQNPGRWIFIDGASLNDHDERDIIKSFKTLPKALAWAKKEGWKYTAHV